MLNTFEKSISLPVHREEYSLEQEFKFSGAIFLKDHIYISNTI